MPKPKFKNSQQIICLADYWESEGFKSVGPKRGEIVTVRHYILTVRNGKLYISIEGYEGGFDQNYFAPAQTDKSTTTAEELLLTMPIAEPVEELITQEIHP